MKKIFLVFAFIAMVFGEDITTITNTGSANLPKIIVQDASNLDDENFGQKMFKLVVGDLKVGATFDVSTNYYQNSYDAPYSANLPTDEKPALIVRYQVMGGMHSQSTIKAKVFNANDGSVMYESSYSTDGSKYPFLAHNIISEIVKKLGYSDVDWMKTMIIFSRYTGVKSSEILVADYTLTYQKVVVSGGLNIFPKWANDAQTAFYFTSYINGNTPAIFKQNLGGSKSKILTGQGMTIVSDVSKDGSKLLVTNAPKGQPEIYLYSGGSLRAITDYNGIDVSGNFVDNDSRVVFVSDRLGYPNIFVTGIDGGNVQQMVYHGKNNNSISTHGSDIVYASRDGGGFNLYLISTQTDYVRQLTADGNNQFPRFSSDGGSIMYIKGGSAVGIIRVNENRSFQFPLRIGRIQSVDW